MFYFAGIFLKDGFVGSLRDIYLDNASGAVGILGLSREPVTMPATAWRNGIK